MTRKVFKILKHDGRNLSKVILKIREKITHLPDITETKAKRKLHIYEMASKMVELWGKYSQRSWQLNKNVQETCVCWKKNFFDGLKSDEWFFWMICWIFYVHTIVSDTPVHSLMCLKASSYVVIFCCWSSPVSVVLPWELISSCWIEPLWALWRTGN